MAKHFPGGGPQKDGEDPHFTYGKEQVYPGGNFRYHLEPFIAAIDAGVASMMPYYGMPVGTEYEEVGFAFNKAIVTDLLRSQLGFDGVVCTDFGLLTDIEILGAPMPAKAWGLENKTRQERIVRLLDAGVDQFGGELCTEELVTAVRLGRVPESRLDESVVRLLTQKFELGLFEHPLADEEQAVAIAGNETFVAEGLAAQRASMTLLSNTERDGVPDPADHRRGQGVRREHRHLERGRLDPGRQPRQRPTSPSSTSPRRSSPADPVSSCSSTPDPSSTPPRSRPRLRAICEAVPTVIDITLDRAAVLGDLVDHAAAIIADYGASDAARLDVLTGRAKPEGKLPFDLPSSMDAVRASREDTPFDTESPAFRFGHGLSYAN